MIQSLHVERVNLPLSIARFTAVMGCNTPLDAMRRATARSLERYYELSTSAKRIDVGTLCRSMGVEAEGVPIRPMSCGLQTGGEISHAYSGILDLSGAIPVITVPPGFDYVKARITAAHELGHVLIHKRASGYDQVTLRLGTTAMEETLAEYAARLLLIPKNFIDFAALTLSGNLAVRCIELAEDAGVSIHAAVARVGDPDVPDVGVRGAIRWRVRSRSIESEPQTLASYWHLCGATFVPLRRGGVRKNSLVARLFEDFDGPISDSDREDVRIGQLCGCFRVDAFAWGSKKNGTRHVLSIFRYS